MSSYATEFTHEDSDGDVLWVNRCTISDKPMMLLLDEGRSGIELYREDVARLATYLAEVIDKVAPRPGGTPRPVPYGKELERQRLTLDATETIDDLLRRHGISRALLSERAGLDADVVLAGDRSLTLETLADLAFHLGYRLHIGSQPAEGQGAALARLTPQTVTVSPEAFDALTAELDEPPEPSPELVELMNRPRPWATEADTEHLPVDSYSLPGGTAEGHLPAAGAIVRGADGDEPAR